MSIFINFEEEAEEPVEVAPIAQTSPVNEHLDKSVDELSFQFALTIASRMPTSRPFVTWW